MRPDDHDAGFLWDILAAARLIQDFTGGMNEDAFKADPKTQSAVIRQQEIIGEATKLLSRKFRDAHPDIRWDDMAGMRDVLIHAYKKVRLDRVWNTATQSVPELIAYLEPLLPRDRVQE